jgi:hypothetical protein
VYSIRLADHFAENEQDEKEYEDYGGNQKEAQTRIVSGLIDHYTRDVLYLFDSIAHVVGDTG